ncbi:MAG: hypothetical protein LBL86_07845 [Coriobacteriales bacterium]|jgi:hypothetical protein|nr:hypothetical protein [Coriobacteriales bacterium]
MMASGKGRGKTAVAAFLALALAIALALGLAGCGGGGGSGDGAEVAEVAEAPESILSEKIDELTDEKNPEEEDGSGLVGTLSTSYVDDFLAGNPVIDGKFVNHVYFGVAGKNESASGLSGIDLAVARAAAKAKKAEGSAVDYKVHKVNLNSGVDGSTIAAVNTFTTDEGQACRGVLLRLCKNSGVGSFESNNVVYKSVDGTDLNAGAGGRYIYLLEGRGNAGVPLREVGFFVDTQKDCLWLKRNGIEANVYKYMSFNPFSPNWTVVCQTPSGIWHGDNDLMLDDDTEGRVDLNARAGGDYVYMMQRFAR